MSRSVKREHGDEYVAIRLDDWSADAVALVRRNAVVTQVREQGRDLEVALRDGADPQRLLNELVAEGVRLRRFEIAEPSLEQIFIERVGAQEGAEGPEELAYV
jgi:ABC-2 type transport system ATP-binding protein